MLLNGSSINAIPINDDFVNYDRLVIGAREDSLNVYELGERWALFSVIATAELALLESVAASVQRSSQIYEKLVSDTLLAIDTGYYLARYRNSLFTEALSLGDASTLSRFLNRWMTDELTAADEAFKFRLLARRLEDLIVAAESVPYQKVKQRSGEDVLLATDIGRLLGWDVTATASLTLLDELIKSVTNAGGVVVRVASDAVLLTDGVVYGLLRGRTQIDSITITESGLGADLEHLVTFTETVDLTDQTLARRLRQVVTTEGVTLLDLLASTTTSTRIFTQVTSDAILVGDQALVSHLRGRWSSDSLAAGDGAAYSLARLRQLLDGVSFTDGQLRFSHVSKSTGELLSLADEQVKQIIFAVLYDVRLLIGVGAEPRLGARDQFAMSSHDGGFKLGAY